MEYEFDLDNAISDLNSVPDDLKHFYKQGDGGYRVADNMVGAAKRLNGLTTNLKTERSKKTEAGNDAAKYRNANKGFTDLLASIPDLSEDQRTPEGLKTYLTDLAAKAAKGGKAGEEAQRQLDAVRQQAAKDKNDAVAEIAKERDAMQGSLFKYMVGDVANTALNEHKGNPLFLRPHIDAQTKVVKQDDGSYAVRVLDNQGNIRYNGEGNPMTVPELVAAMKKDERFAAAFEGRVAAGGGTQSSRKTDHKQVGSSGGGEKTATQKIADGIRARKGR